MTVDIPHSPLAGVAMGGRGWGIQHEDGPPLVLVHGLVVSSTFLAPSAERLGRSMRVLAPDLPGFGSSEKPYRALSVPELGTALIHWMDSARLAGVSMAAVSFGCQVATEVAMRRPDLVERLVLASPTIDPSARTVGQQLRRWRRETATQSGALKKLIVREYAQAGLLRALTTFRHAISDRIEERLPYVQAPTLVLRGTADPLVRRRWAREVAELVPRGRFQELPDAPHAMCFDAADAFSEAVRGFLVEDPTPVAAG